MTEGTWYSEAPPPVVPAPGVAGWLRVAGRGVALLLLLLGGLGVHALLGLAERLLHGARRRWTTRFAQSVCRGALRVLGIGWRREGQPMTGAGAVVANHAGWLDIFALNAVLPVTFVAKADVAGWPGIGWMARAAGTVFIRRNRAESRAHAVLFGARIAGGARLLFFPEGTSTDGHRVLPFKSTLFQAFFMQNMSCDTQVQPVTVIWTAPRGVDPRFYAWWGDMEFGPHLLAVLAARRQGRVTVICHPPIATGQVASRKVLAQLCEAAVRAGHPASQGPGGAASPHDASPHDALPHDRDGLDMR